jgi:hypothetical protein
VSLKWVLPSGVAADVRRTDVGRFQTSARALRSRAPTSGRDLQFAAANVTKSTADGSPAPAAAAG